MLTLVDVPSILQKYLTVRKKSEELTAPLEIEDYVVQPMMDVSPPKWHLGHTSWFFDAFILQPYYDKIGPRPDKYNFIFNSYYNHAGDRVFRPWRGYMSRPTVKQVMEYRHLVDQEMEALLEDVDNHPERESILSRLELGLHHEQQHQELFLMDIKYIYYINVLKPAYAPSIVKPGISPLASNFISIDGGLLDFGRDETEEPFGYDNESPRHRAYVENFKIQNRPVSNGEYLEFIRDGGYRDFRHWLSDAWDTVNQERWQAPLYWEPKGDDWSIFTLNGELELNPDEPVSHLSYYEAAAYAAWAEKRLPTEYEWELAARRQGAGVESGNFVENGFFHPIAPGPEKGGDFLGNLWEWTASAYLPFPGFQPAQGALGEYNGKFMNDQRVLKGGSCVTSRSHSRLSYRNFFQGDKRWPFTGLRLAE